MAMEKASVFLGLQNHRGWGGRGRCDVLGTHMGGGARGWMGPLQRLGVLWRKELQDST